MKLLAIEKEMPGATAAQFQAHGKAEAARVWELYRDGVFREMYFDRDKHVAVIILECADVDAANAALNSLPFVREGLIAFDVLPLVPYTGFSRLFVDQT